MDSGNELRSPIYLCLGDSKVGKSQLLSFLGCQNVTEKKKKRFTQRIEICYLQKSHIEAIAKKQGVECKLGIPGILMVEMPSDAGERTQSRLVELSDVAVLVVNRLSSFTTHLIKLISKSAPCVIVLNKIDTMTQHQITEVNEKVKELAPTQKIVIVSALKGEGMPEFMQTLFQVSDTLDRKFLGKKAECKVLDVKEVLGHGTLLLVVVVDGVLYAKDTVVVSSSEGPIVSNIKSLWLPRKSGGLFLAEGPYDKEEEEIRAGRAVLVALKDEGSGSLIDMNLQVLGPDDDVEKLKTNAKCDALTALFQMHLRVGIPLG